MKRSELICGSVVAEKGNEANRIKVNGITPRKIQYIDESKQPKYLRHSQLVPIELNDFILGQLGFEKRQGTFGKVVRNDFVLVLVNKKDENEFYTITAEPDEELGWGKCRAIHIDDARYSSVGFGYVCNVHELQSLIFSTIKMHLNTEKLFEGCGEE